MKKLRLETRHDEARYSSYVVGFVLSVITTLLAYFFVVNHVWPKDILVYVILGLAVVQLIVQLVFFLHVGRGSRLNIATFYFALAIILIIGVGSVWIMQNLDYNMMHMSPQQMEMYMYENQGL